ncbi:MAG: FAD-dependent oxidoreductase [Defluviimonas sp.]|nr:FAD-dependent oxidoreductase [Defluviimonas sp.]
MSCGGLFADGPVPERHEEPTLKKAVLLAVLVAAVVALLAGLRGQGLDLDGLRDLILRLRVWQGENAALFVLACFVIYVAVAALSLPLAVWMTLGAGALFGFWQGLLIVSFASSMGATLAFLAARYLLRDWVRARLGARAAAIDEGMRRDGPFFLFSLRLIPVIPFFAVNLLMGLTPMRTPTFYLVSQAGMLAGTAVYVNAGTQLARLESLSGIVSAPLLFSFALLGLFPWIARMVLNLLKRRRVYARWTRPGSFDRNLIVIGAGSAGLVSAYIAAATRAKVTLIEANRMGGDCLNYGCVPSKALIRSAKLAHQMRKADRYGLCATEPAIPFARVMARIHKVIADIAPHDSVERYTGLGVEVLQGYARLVDPWTVEIAMKDGQVRRLTTRAVIIATGAAPFVPPLPGLDDVGYLTSDTLWDRLGDREHAPKRLVVLGGGPIGAELAQSFARLGSRVIQIEMAPRLMMREDAEVSALVRASLEADGVQVLTGHKALACGIADGEKWIEVEHEGETRRIAFDEMIAAVGRAPRLKGFGLEELGIEVDRVVETNAYLETLYPNILAAGDVAGPYQFTHTAGHQAWFAAVNALFGDVKRFKADYRVIPWATFTDPEVARVGLSEAEAREKGIAFEVTRYGIEELDRAIADGSAHGFVKVLTVPGKDRILGVTIVGEHAGDLIAEFVLAMKHGLGLGKILGTIHIYPTLAEANRSAAGEWRRAHVSPRLLAWVERYHAWRRG